MSYAIRRWVVALFPVLVLSACAAPPGGDVVAAATDITACRGDAYALGVEDGFGGASVATRPAACADAGAPVARDAYSAGWAEGLVRYCAPEHAATLPVSAEVEAIRCPPHMRDAFLGALGTETSAGWFEGVRPVIRPVLSAGVRIGSGGIRPVLGGGVSIGFWPAGSDRLDLTGWIRLADLTGWV